MATTAEWLEGARLRTLPAAISPVLAGTGAALGVQANLPWGRAFLALIVALALQVGVNYANDYSDGIRGTDAERIGPLRLVGSGAASPKAVKWAAYASFLVAAISGLGLVLLTGHYWLLLVGLAAIAAAWGYTGGPRPYGYAGLGEVFVFVFFGLVAVCGTVFVLVDTVPAAALILAIIFGGLSCAILVANNLRDLDSDVLVGKRTLATKLGDRGSRRFFLALCLISEALLLLVAWLSTPWVLLGLGSGLLLIFPIREISAGVMGKRLVSVLKWTGIAQLVCSVGVFAGYVIALAN